MPLMMRTIQCRVWFVRFEELAIQIVRRLNFADVISD